MGSNLPRKIKEIGLNLEKLDEQILFKILERVENEVEDFLRKVLPPKSEYDLVISLSKENNYIIFTIDLGIKAGYEDLINYNDIIGDAINVARRRLEKELQRYRRTGGANSDNSSESKG